MRPGVAVLLALAVAADAIAAGREPVLKQIDLPHNYYFREMYLPQLTSGPQYPVFSPDGAELVYSMATASTTTTTPATAAPSCSPATAPRRTSSMRSPTAR